MRLRWGILGVAKINERLIPGFRKAGNAELRAIASRSLEKARAAATDTGIPHAFGSYEGLLAEPGIDAVYIPLPNHLHAEWTRKAADAGKHVLCEKPMTTSGADSRALVDYCRAKGVRLMEGFIWRHHPRTHQLRKFLDGGGIGKVIHVTAALTFQLVMSPANIRLRPETGGGSLLDTGCYAVYGIRWAMGDEPTSVMATAVYENGVDLRMTGILKFSGGRTGAFDCGFTLPYRGGMEIVGTEGIIRVPRMWLPPNPATCEIERAGAVESVAVNCESQVAYMIEEFGQAVLEERDPLPPAEEAVKTAKVMDALAKAALEGREASV
jgi:xylose dehydrogenase (NAD/NADP)